MFWQLGINCQNKWWFNTYELSEQVAFLINCQGKSQFDSYELTVEISSDLTVTNLLSK